MPSLPSPFPPSPSQRRRRTGQGRPPPAAVTPPLRAATPQIEEGNQSPAPPWPFFPPTRSPPRPQGRRPAPPHALPCFPVGMKKKRANMPKTPSPLFYLFKSPPTF